MRAMPRIAVVVICVVAFALGVGAGVAVAAHTHTIGHIYHGLGDGGNNNYYVHPFSDVTDNHAVNNLYYQLWREGTYMSSGICDCGHVHTNWDTSPYAECRYRSNHSADGSGNHFLNFHRHNHHNWCG